MNLSSLLDVSPTLKYLDYASRYSDAIVLDSELDLMPKSMNVREENHIMSTGMFGTKIAYYEIANSISFAQELSLYISGSSKEDSSAYLRWVEEKPCDSSTSSTLDSYLFPPSYSSILYSTPQLSWLEWDQNESQMQMSKHFQEFEKNWYNQTHKDYSQTSSAPTHYLKKGK